jgi:uncharacterized protein with FMN-binding domain
MHIMKKEKHRKGKSKVWIVLLIIVGVLGLVMVGGIVFTAPGRAELQNLSIAAVDIKKLPDGVYAGAYKGAKDSMRNAAVEVTVQGGAIKDIKVTQGALAKEKQSTELRGGLSIDVLFGRVIHSQSLQVDVISGATLTCKAHLKAVENALIH